MAAIPQITEVKITKLTYHNDAEFSHKFYHVVLLRWIENGNQKFQVIAKYGKIGGYATSQTDNMQGYTKIHSNLPVYDLDVEALAEFQKLVNKKKKEGYK